MLASVPRARVTALRQHWWCALVHRASGHASRAWGRAARRGVGAPREGCKCDGRREARGKNGTRSTRWSDRENFTLLRRLAPLRRARRRRRHGVRRVDGASGGERAVRRGLPRRRGEARGASRPSLTPRAPRVVLAEKRSKRFGFIVSFLPPRPPPRLPPSHVFSSSPVRPPADRPVALPASSLLFSSLLVVVVFQGLGCSRKTARDVVQLFRRADKNADFRRVLHTGPHTTASAW